LLVICVVNSALGQQSVPTSAAGDAARAPSQSAPSSAAGDPVRTDSPSRLRWGISSGGGPLLGGYSGGVGGIDARIGVQINRVWGIYGQPIILVGARAPSDSEDTGITGLAVFGLGALADVTLGDLFYALGPEILFGYIGETKVTNDSNRTSGASGPFFSIAARTGVAFGSMRPNRRRAFAIGFDVHVGFANDVVATMPLLFLGYESF
jgi:hypothetical protein